MARLYVRTDNSIVLYYIATFIDHYIFTALSQNYIELVEAALLAIHDQHPKLLGKLFKDARNAKNFIT